MRIEDQAQLGLNKMDQTIDKKKTSSSTSGSASTTSGSDSVSLSDSAKDLAALKSGLANTPDVRADRVAELKNQIDSGTYNVSGRQVAEKIVQTAVDGLY